MKKKIICFSLMITLILVGTMGSFFNSYAFNANKTADIEKDTHYRILKRAMKLLESDNPEMYNISKDYILTMQEGSAWEDGKYDQAHYIIPPRPRTHYYDPYTGMGYTNDDMSSKDKCEQMFNRALSHYKSGKIDDAFYSLGRAIHLLQDAHVPHHAKESSSYEATHKTFEQHAKTEPCMQVCIDTATNKEFRNTMSSTSPRIDISQTLHSSTIAGNWIHYITLISRPYLGHMNSLWHTTKMETAGKYLLPLTVGTTEGFIQYFFNRLISDGVNVGYSKRVIDNPGYWKTITKTGYGIIGYTGYQNYVSPIYGETTITEKILVGRTYKDVWVKVPYYDYSKYNL